MAADDGSAADLGVYDVAVLNGGPPLAITTAVTMLHGGGVLCDGWIPGTLAVNPGWDGDEARLAPLERELVAVVRRAGEISPAVLERELDCAPEIRRTIDEAHAGKEGCSWTARASSGRPRRCLDDDRARRGGFLVTAVARCRPRGAGRCSGNDRTLGGLTIRAPARQRPGRSRWRARGRCGAASPRSPRSSMRLGSRSAWMAAADAARVGVGELSMRPTRRRTTRAEKPAAAAAASARAVRILVVEDDPHMAAALQDALVRRGYDVTRARSGPEALALCADQHFDLVLLDLRLPDIHADVSRVTRLAGAEVAVRLRATTTTPIVVVTGIDEERSKVSLLRGGVDDYIVKPYSEPELLARIETGCDGRGVAWSLRTGRWTSATCASIPRRGR